MAQFGYNLPPHILTLVRRSFDEDNATTTDSLVTPDSSNENTVSPFSHQRSAIPHAVQMYPCFLPRPHRP